MRWSTLTKRLWISLPLILFTALFLFATSGWRMETEVEVKVENVEEPAPVFQEDPELEIIRKKHLVKYDPTAPTNYSGGRFWNKAKEMSKLVVEHLGFKRNGFFVECGALDGVYLSNSLYLEQKYGWSGLLVEADPVSNRILKGRNRHAWVADVCLAPVPHPMKLQLSGQPEPEISYFKNPNHRNSFMGAQSPQRL